MQALILAAGRGARLGLEPDRPKCLADVGGRALLDRYLDALDTLSVPATIVIGHAAEAIRSHVAARATRPSLVMNDRYVEGSVVSLAAGLATLDDDLLLLDGDVAFAPSLLDALHPAPASDALLVDLDGVFTDEQYMAGVRDGCVVALRRAALTAADGHQRQGEWVGFAKLSAAAVAQLCAAVDQQIARGGAGGGYEDALAGLLASVRFACVPTAGAPWVEIDFPADLARARELFA